MDFSKKENKAALYLHLWALESKTIMFSTDPTSELLGHLGQNKTRLLIYLYLFKSYNWQK